MKRIIVLLAALVVAIVSFSFTNVVAAETEPVVRVKLSEFIGINKEIPLNIKGEYLVDSVEDIILSEGHTYKLSAQGTTEVCLYEGSDQLACGEALNLAPLAEGSYINLKNYAYNGKFTFNNVGGIVTPINSVFMEDYVNGVVPKEMEASTWPLEAFKAQALAARSYAYYRKNSILQDGTYHQVYGGYYWIPDLNPISLELTRKAVKDTQGEYVTYEGTAPDTAYSASNGGHTESALNYWGYEHPYLPAQVDEEGEVEKYNYVLQVQQQQIDMTELDMKNPDLWWNSAREADQDFTNRIKNNLLADLNAENIRIVEIERIEFHTFTSGKRVKEGAITFTYFDKTKLDEEGNLVLQTYSKEDVSQAQFTSLYGYKMKNIYIQEFSNDNGVFTVKAGGYGHGVGMSQYGAKERALKGQSYTEILAFYYPGTEITQRYTELADRNSMLASLSGLVIKDGVRYYFDPVTGEVSIGWVEIEDNWYYFDADGVGHTGWLKESDNWYYFNSKGIMQTGWTTISDKKYYFDEDGAMQTGWIKHNNNWYYLNEEGVMQTGWLTLDSSKYYLNEEGIVQTGWLTLGEDKYYLDGNGVLQTGWLTLENNKYYLNEEGVMQTGWLTLDSSKYYLNEEGVMQTGWLTIDSNKYYLNEEGIVQTGWLTLGEDKYYLDGNGVLQTGWLTLENNKYYLNEEGVMQTGWLILGSNKYYLNEEGVMQTGWLTLDSNKYYLNEEGVMETGWITLGSNKYYLNEEGIMQTGWLTLDSDKYYLNEEGVMQTGWLTLGSNKYYMNEKGIVQTGWLTLGEDKYYLDENGAMQTGWLTIDGTKYFFSEDGKLQKQQLAGWTNEDGKLVYYDPSTGRKIHSGWKLIDNQWYYFENSAAKTGWQYWKYKWYYLEADTGKMLTGWINDGSKRYYLDSDGIMQTGWVKSNNKWYFLAKSGAMHKGWLTDAGKKYYLKSDGIMATGWLKIGTSWYYFHSSGAMDTGWLKWNNKWYYMNSYGIMQTGWEKVGTKWYYLASGGEMKTGWVKDGTKWYYLASSGIMQTGWVKVGTKWYYLYSSGAMAANTTIGGYRLGSDGAWIR